jgi:predicted dehydrogenase
VTSAAPEVRIGMVGYGFMGRAHSQAWRTVGKAFDLPVRPSLAVIGGRDEAAVRAAADRLGWESYETDWRRMIARDDLDVIDICSPGDTHVEVALAALAAGKHVLCEKPLANTVAEAERMADAADAARTRGVVSMVGFSYRRTPALALAQRLIADGRVGQVRHIRAAYLQDWLSDPEFPRTWRLQRELAGSGALGDIGAHVVDLAQFLTGQRLTGVSALLQTFVSDRPLPDGSGRGAVTVDDAAAFLARTDGGALAVFEATRFALGRRNAMRIEVNGTAGSIAFDFEAMNELHVYDGTVPAADAGFRRILVTEAEHPYLSGWWPPGHGLGYEHTFSNQAKDFLDAVATGGEISPSFRDGMQVQQVLAAVERSAADEARWTAV